MTSLTAARPPREGHLMDEDRAPRRTPLSIRVYEVDPATMERREVRPKQTWSISRDPVTAPKFPLDLAPCTCELCEGTL